MLLGGRKNINAFIFCVLFCFSDFWITAGNFFQFLSPFSQDSNSCFLCHFMINFPKMNLKCFRRPLLKKVCILGEFLKDFPTTQ